MRLSTGGMIVCFTFAISSCTRLHHEKEDKGVIGFDPYHIRLSDGTQVGIFAREVFPWEGRRQSGEVWLHLFAKDTKYFLMDPPMDPPIWMRQLTSVDYVPGKLSLIHI